MSCKVWSKTNSTSLHPKECWECQISCPTQDILNLHFNKISRLKKKEEEEDGGQGVGGSTNLGELILRVIEEESVRQAIFFKKNRL